MVHDGDVSPVVAQAVGVLMQRYSLLEWKAADLLAHTAARDNKSLEAIAQGFVDEVKQREQS